MNLDKANRRDKKIKKRKYGHVMDGKATREIPRYQVERAKRRKQKNDNNTTS